MLGVKRLREATASVLEARIPKPSGGPSCRAIRPLSRDQPRGRPRPPSLPAAGVRGQRGVGATLEARATAGGGGGGSRLGQKSRVKVTAGVTASEVRVKAEDRKVWRG